MSEPNRLVFYPVAPPHMFGGVPLENIFEIGAPPAAGGADGRSPHFSRSAPNGIFSTARHQAARQKRQQESGSAAVADAAVVGDGNVPYPHSDEGHDPTFAAGAPRPRAAAKAQPPLLHQPAGSIPSPPSAERPPSPAISAATHNTDGAATTNVGGLTVTEDVASLGHHSDQIHHDHDGHRYLVSSSAPGGEAATTAELPPLHRNEDSEATLLAVDVSEATSQSAYSAGGGCADIVDLVIPLLNVEDSADGSGLGDGSDTRRAPVRRTGHIKGHTPRPRRRGDAGPPNQVGPLCAAATPATTLLMLPRMGAEYEDEGGPIGPPHVVGGGSTATGTGDSSGGSRLGEAVRGYAAAFAGRAVLLNPYGPPPEQCSAAHRPRHYGLQMNSGRHIQNVDMWPLHVPRDETSGAAGCCSSMGGMDDSRGTALRPPSSWASPRALGPRGFASPQPHPQNHQGQLPRSQQSHPLGDPPPPMLDGSCSSSMRQIHPPHPFHSGARLSSSLASWGGGGTLPGAGAGSRSTAVPTPLAYRCGEANGPNVYTAGGRARQTVAGRHHLPHLSGQRGPSLGAATPTGRGDEGHAFPRGEIPCRLSRETLHWHTVHAADISAPDGEPNPQANPLVYFHPLAGQDLPDAAPLLLYCSRSGCNFMMPSPGGVVDTSTTVAANADTAASSARVLTWLGAVESVSGVEIEDSYVDESSNPLRADATAEPTSGTPKPQQKRVLFVTPPKDADSPVDGPRAPSQGLARNSVRKAFSSSSSISRKRDPDDVTQRCCVLQ